MRRLYHLPLSPFCRKIRLALAEKRIEVDLIEELPWERRIDFLRLNPAGLVPVFVDADGTVVCDSAVIVEYLEETQPQVPLLPGDAAARAEARRIAAWFDDRFHRDVMVNLVEERVTKKLMKAGHPDSAKIKAGARNVKLHMEYVDWLADRRRWLAGEELTIADFAAAAHISCLDYIGDIDWSRTPAAKDWYARIKSRPAFRPLLADHLSGFTAPEHYADLDF